MLFSCEPVAVPESRGDKLAKSLCGCTTALLDLNERAQTSSDSLAFRNIATEFEKTRACVSQLGIKTEDRAALGTGLTAHCPELAKHTELLTELLGE